MRVLATAADVRLRGARDFNLLLAPLNIIGWLKTSAIGRTCITLVAPAAAVPQSKAVNQVAAPIHRAGPTS
jgi:hypothetical protein